MSTEKPVAVGFEPPKYLASLIAAVNDGAKAAQGGLLLYMLVGLYLLASAFSSTDEDLLLGKAVTIAQINTSLPVSFSFAIAPLVFVFLHVYTLTRFDMLAANVRHFMEVLRDSVPGRSNREHCLHLLSNVEFVLALTAEPDSTLHNGFWRWMVRGLLAAFPVTILLLVQINALRYQSNGIRWAQFAWLLADLAALVWFFWRNRLVNVSSMPRWRAVLRRVALPGLPASVLAFNILYLNVVPESADAKIVRGDWSRWQDLVWQPFDTLACPNLGWGCRYLRVERRTLVGRVWDDKAMVALSGDAPDFAKLLPGIEGVELRERSLRFAVLDGSRLFNASLSFAQLAGADLSGARLAGANLVDARLAGANLSWARLAGANLSGARLAGANLSWAQLAGANLVRARLAGADLSGAGAQLAGANLSWAQLAGANLSGARLAGANLRNARAPLVVSDEGTTFASADFRGITFALPEGGDLAQIKADLAEIPEGDLKKDAERRLSSVLAGKTPPGWTLHFVATDHEKLLVSSLDNPAFSAHPQWLTSTMDDAWRSALANRLATDLAHEDPAAADGVALSAVGVMNYGRDPKDKRTGGAIACRLLVEASATPPHLNLSRDARAELVDALHRASLTCYRLRVHPDPVQP